MSTPVRVVDGTGTRFVAGVTEDSSVLTGEVHVRGSTIPRELLTANKALVEFLRNSAGSRDANVNGAVTPVLFSLSAAPTDAVRYISRLRFIFHDGNMTLSVAGDLRRFGTAAAAPGLTNGLLLRVEQIPITTQIFSDPVRNIADFFNYVTRFQNFANGISAGVDYLSLDYDFVQPIVLPAGTLDRVVMTVQDDLTAVDLFQVIALGWQDTT